MEAKTNEIYQLLLDKIKSTLKVSPRRFDYDYIINEYSKYLGYIKNIINDIVTNNRYHLLTNNYLYYIASNDYNYANNYMNYIFKSLHELCFIYHETGYSSLIQYYRDLLRNSQYKKVVINYNSREPEIDDLILAINLARVEDYLKNLEKTHHEGTNEYYLMEYALLATLAYCMYDPEKRKLFDNYFDIITKDCNQFIDRISLCGIYDPEWITIELRDKHNEIRRYLVDYLENTYTNESPVIR